MCFEQADLFVLVDNPCLPRTHFPSPPPVLTPPLAAIRPCTSPLPLRNPARPSVFHAPTSARLSCNPTTHYTRPPPKLPGRNPHLCSPRPSMYRFSKPPSTFPSPASAPRPTCACPPFPLHARTFCCACQKACNITDNIALFMRIKIVLTKPMGW